MEAAIGQVESRLVPTVPPEPDPSTIRVQIEGELFANHSFSNINEVLALQFLENDDFAVSIDRRQRYPAFDSRAFDAHRLHGYVGRAFEGGPDVVIRHAYPPNWDPVTCGKWIHIQPWEFGHLPTEWLAPLVNQVDEVWAPSTYVRDVYVRSGVPATKIVVIPWGVRPDVYHADVPPLFLPTDKAFKFLFVGGVIERKGFDTLLAAYLEEFRPQDDAVLVVKDMGSQSFYRGDRLRDQLLRARDDPRKPAITYLDGHLTPGQLASLYAACDCLVAPYRGEGFGLPILEAMACGTVPIVPDQGASVDFVSNRTAYLVPSQEVETTHTEPLCGPPLELHIQLQDLQRVMRHVFENPAAAHRKGRKAARHVARQFTWRRTVHQMSERIRALADPKSRVAPATAPMAGQGPGPTLAACLRVRNAERELAKCLAHVAAIVDEIVVFDDHSNDRTAAVAREYGATVVEFSGDGPDHAVVASDWMFWLDVGDCLSQEDLNEIRSLLKNQPPVVSELHIELTDHSPKHTNHPQPRQLHLVRTRRRT